MANVFEVLDQRFGRPGDVDAAFGSYKPVLLELCAGKTVLEVGAGRNPIFTPEEIKKHKIDYHANDISQVELDNMLVKYPARAFDTCGMIPAEWHGKFEVIFSRMVQEHVRDGWAFYRNLGVLLKDGGCVLNFHPTLFAFPFIMNRIIPENLSEKIMFILAPQRTRERTPKFPAYYQFCRHSDGVVRKIKACGFKAARLYPFYHHGYYRRIPVLGKLHVWFSRLAQRRGWKLIATYSYSVAIK